jgi:hypothetical protein
MAKASLDNDLFRKLRASGMRKRAARAIAEAGDNSSKLVRGTVDELRGLAEQIENRARGGTGTTAKARSAAAKKAAGTRKREAAKRSNAAKKAAATRAKKAGSSSSSSRSSSSRSSGSRSSRSRS